MIDIHCHIIPGVDDGSEDAAESIAMGENAQACGVTDIIVTPHCNIPGEYGNYRGEGYERAFARLCGLFERNDISVRLHRGMEVFGTDDVPELFDRKRIMTLADSRYMLIEFPFDDDMWRVRDVLSALLRRGVTPIVAHPERYYAVNDDIGFALDWADMGCLLQLNRTSLIGPPAYPETRTSRALLEMGAAHFVATDAHGVLSRTTSLIDAYEFVSKRFSPEWADILMTENPRRVLEDKRILRLPQ